MRHEYCAEAPINSAMAQDFGYWLICVGHPDAAMALLVAPAAFLRPSEVISLHWHDVLRPVILES